MRERFVLEALRNFGVGLMVGAFILRLSEKITDLTLWVILSLGLVYIFIAAILLPEEV